MSTFVYLAAPASQFPGLRRAIRRQGIREVGSPSQADAVIVAGTTSATYSQLEDWLRQGKQILCSPATEAPKGASVASHLRFIPGALEVRQLLKAGALGTELQFLARIGTPGLARLTETWSGSAAVTGLGVMMDPGAEILDLLSWWLGPLQSVSTQDDGKGGSEAEFHGTYRGPHATGSVLLSRLRPLAQSIEITGSGGKVTVDFSRGSPALQASLANASGIAPRGRSLSQLHGRRLDTWRTGSAAADELFLDAGTSSLVSAWREQRRPLRHPWELRQPRELAPLRGRRVLVTGGTGFIGARLVECLAEMGAAVTVLVRSARNAARVARLDVRLIKADLVDLPSVAADIGQQEIVFSVAYDFRASIDENARAVELLAAACRQMGARRLVQVSSIAVYDGWPRDNLDELSPASHRGHPYKLAKLKIESELAARARRGDFTVVVLQPTIVYGPFSRFWTDELVARMRLVPTRLPASHAGICNGVYVDDVVDALLAAATVQVATVETFIISGPEPFPWRQLFECYARAAGQPLILDPSAPSALPASEPRPSLKDRVIRMALPVVSRSIVPLVRNAVGNRRFDALVERCREYLTRRQGSFRPVESNPALYASQARCSIGKASRLLVEPVVRAEQGLELTRRYVEWKQAGSTD